jgi:LPS-assembly protein
MINFYLKLVLILMCFSFQFINILYADEFIGLINKLIQTSNKNKYQSCNYDNTKYNESDNPNINPKVIVITADKSDGKKNGVFLLEGNVVAYKDDKIITSDWLTYEQNNSHIVGQNVILYRRYNEIKGKWVDYYFNLDNGYVLEAEAKDYKSNMTARAKKLDIISNDKFIMDKGYFTSCKIDNPDWHISADKLTFDYQDSQGNAKKSTFYIKDLPVFYTPYLQFPLGKRRSGILTPELGGQTAGYFIGIPFYWNMADNYDMTITPKFYFSSGVMLGDEFRYLNDNGLGSIYTEQVWQNKNLNYLYYWHLKDDHYFDKSKWGIGYDYSVVSDDNYFVDYGNFNTTVNNINLLRSAYLKYSPNWGKFDIHVQGYQTLFPSNQPPSQYIYSVLPQIDFVINDFDFESDAANFKFNFVSQYSNFSTELLSTGYNSLQNGQRIVVYPSIMLPKENSWGYIKPKLGLHDTYYQLQPYPQFQNNFNEINRLLPIASVDTSIIFDKELELNSIDYISTIEPRLYYLYIPQINQSNIPVFDTAVASPNLNQLFNENIFSGFDRINSANNITLGMTSRLINSTTANELYNFGIGYKYYITSNNNLLYGSYNQFGQLYQPTPNFITEITNNWTNTISTMSSFQYDSVFNNIDAYSFQLKYNPDNHKIINARFNYQYQLPVFYYAWSIGQNYAPLFTENQYAIDISGQWPLFSEHWLVDGRTNYDFTRSQFLNALGGIEYNGGCWSVSVIYQQYLVNLSQYNQAYFVQFSLGGLTNIGLDPTQQLQLNIPGYVPIKPVY